MALAEDIEKFRFHPAIDDDRLCQDNQNLLWGRVDRNAECPKDMNAPHVFLLLLKVSYSNNVPEMFYENGDTSAAPRISEGP